MKQSSKVFSNFTTDRTILFLTVINALFWGFGRSINIYSLKIVGIIFELLWLPALVGLFVMPILSVTFWVKEKFDLKSLNLYSFIIATITIIATIFFSNHWVK